MDRREQEKKILGELHCPDSDALLKPGVLLSDEIKRFVNQFKLIDPFKEENLKAAGYELTVGDEYAIGGKTGKLFDEPGRNEVSIPPFQVLIIKTTERINLPRFLIARWNIRVRWAYEGLLWVGGPQVDPGWEGHLLCPLYNLSDKEVTLRLGEPIALMDFVTTTPFKRNQSKEYQRPPTRVLFEDYNTGMKSALFTEAGERIDKVESRVNDLETRLYPSLGLLVALIAILFTSLSILVTSAKEVLTTPPSWLYISTGFSLLAFLLSIFALTKVVSRTHRPAGDDLGKKLKELERLSNLSAIAIVAIIAVIIWKVFLLP